MSAIGIQTVKVIDAISDTLTSNDDFILDTTSACIMKYNSPYIKYGYFMKHHIKLGQILKLIIKTNIMCM